MQLTDWISNNYIELFGAITGIIYVFLEIRQNIWLWPVGIITSGVYIWIFFTGKLYADMSLQGYYLVISVLGWYWWVRKGMMRGGESERGGSIETNKLRDEETEAAKLPSREGQGVGFEETERLKVSHLKLRTGITLSVVFTLLFSTMWLVLDRMTDSPVPGWDSFITSLSIIATWMLARKIYEHWFLWIIVNATAAVLFFSRGLYPTTVLYFIYFAMSYVGLREWNKSLNKSITT